MGENLKVRLATREDEPELMQLCRELHQENGVFDIDEDLVRAMLYQSFDKKGGIVAVIGAPGEIQACISLILSSFWYCRQFHIEELFSYVRPAYRKSDNAKRLIDYAKKCSDDIEIPLVIGVISNERTESKVKLYERRIHKPAGAFFIYNPPVESAFAQAGVENGR